MKPFPYEEILNLGPPQSGKHPKMAVADRAAQFAPFSALTGHGAALAETARLTERRCGCNYQLYNLRGQTKEAEALKPVIEKEIDPDFFKPKPTCIL